MRIHPTAIIEDGAKLGADVEVGPYAMIGPEVVLGDGCVVQGHAILTNRVTMGVQNFVGYGAVIGAAPQDFSHDESVVSSVEIGVGNTFREYVTIHRGTKPGTATTVGDGNLLMVGTHLGHNTRVQNRTVIANNCLLAGYVEVGDQVVLGGGTVFHQHIRIGRLAMVRGGTRFGKDIPPFVSANGDNVLSGLNAVGLRRAGVSSESRLELKRLFKLFFDGTRNVSQAIAEARQREWGADALDFIDFIAGAKKRGTCRGPVVPADSVPANDQD